MADSRLALRAGEPGDGGAIASLWHRGWFDAHVGHVPEQIYVAENARGGGAADALLRHAERAIATRFATGWLAVVAGNARARRFYERHGWREAGAIDYAAEVTDGTMPVPCRRYEKRVSPVQEE